MAGIMVLLDGGTDLVYPQLGGCTPLHWAMPSWHTGFDGCWETCPPGLEVDTLTGVGTLLGLSPAEIPTGRAWLEAVADDKIQPEDQYGLRCNLVTVDGEGRFLSANGAGYTADEKAQAFSLLQAFIPQEIGRLHPLGDYRGVLLLKTVPSFVGDGKPPHQNIGEMWVDMLPIDRKSSVMGKTFTEIQTTVLMPFSRGNTALRAVLWSGCSKTALPAFVERHGCFGGVISGTSVVRGLAKSMGMEAPACTSWTGDIDTNLLTKGQAALELAQRQEFVLLHLNGGDEASHRQNLIEKTTFFTRVEQELLPLLKESGHAILLCTDHGSCCATGAHTGGPQPYRVVSPLAAGGDGPQKAQQAVSYLIKLSRKRG